MPVTESSAWIGVSLERSARQPMHVQLYEMLRTKISGGAVSAGTRLPSSRQFASELGVSRSTVVAAYDQLMAEGYISGRTGARLQVNQLDPPLQASDRTTRRSVSSQDASAPLLLAPGVPDLRLLPNRLWTQAAARSWRNGPVSVFADQNPAGALPLREALAAHLLEWRSIQVDPGQILITSGSAGALQVVLDSLASPGDAVAMEEPGYPAFRKLALRRRMRVVPVQVDEEGMDVSMLKIASSQPALCVVTPSHHYPLGFPMSIGRRHRLLDWANETGGFIVEDDYDSEYRQDGRPVPALFSVAEQSNVIYVGTTSKVFSSSMRIGYMVAPHNLVGKLRQTISDLEQRASIVPQYPLADLIQSGEYSRHLRRMRRVYRERRIALVTMLHSMLAPGSLLMLGQSAGMHLTAQFGPMLESGLDDTLVQKRCIERGVGVRPLSSFYMRPSKRQGLLIGFAAFDEVEMRRGVTVLRAAIAR